MNSKIAQYWLVASQARFAQPKDWAGKLVMELEKPPVWIIDMTMAKDVGELRRAVMLGLEGIKGGELLSPTEMDDAMLGYVWWKYEKNELQLHECLTAIGKAADASCSTVECERIYALLNKLEAHESDKQAIEGEARRILSPLRRMAEQQWAEIDTSA
jgi:hypothetical protein